jgi:hypothetical protein
MCGSLMIIEVSNRIRYICVNKHDAVMGDEHLGTDVDILLEYLKRP